MNRLPTCSAEVSIYVQSAMQAATTATGQTWWDEPIHGGRHLRHVTVTFWVLLNHKFQAKSPVF